MDRPSSNQGPEASWPWTWPLGGDVTQWIRTSWIKSLSDQTGFININNVRAGDPDLERRIIEDVASYGRQLGRMMEALDVVIGQLRGCAPPPGWSLWRSCRLAWATAVPGGAGHPGRASQRPPRRCQP
jgi:hypothetical protein